MKLIIAMAPPRRVLRWTQRLLLAIGVAALGYCGYVYGDAWNFQRAEHLQFQGLLVDRTALRAARKLSPLAASGGLLGRMDIPRLGLSVIVIEGASRTTLRRAAGHIPGTAWPGQSGNVGISGHRDTFFRPLRNIRRNDIITLTTLLGEYRYRVVSTKIVSPSDVAVLDPDGSDSLTLVTCYPFYFVGAAPDRFIVRAERIV
jgi:sortase A